jgi:hypothetical protein
MRFFAGVQPVGSISSQKLFRHFSALLVFHKKLKCFLKSPFINPKLALFLGLSMANVGILDGRDSCNESEKVGDAACSRTVDPGLSLW